MRVETDEQRRIWNTLMAQEHPRGAGPFVGPQLRYLVGSAHLAGRAGSPQARGACGPATPGSAGTRGGAAPASGAGPVPAAGAPRCRVPQLGLPRVGRAARAVGGERAALRLSPLVAGDVRRRDRTDGGEYAGELRVGETRGRGRQDRTHAASETRKAVYMYALEPGWRDTLQAPAPDVAPLAVGAGLVGGERVRGGAAGRRAAERASGAERPADGRVSDARHPRRRERKEGVG